MPFAEALNAHTNPKELAVAPPRLKRSVGNLVADGDVLDFRFAT
jgi:hypothetical protein